MTHKTCTPQTNKQVTNIVRHPYLWNVGWERQSNVIKLKVKSALGFSFPTKIQHVSNVGRFQHLSNVFLTSGASQVVLKLKPEVATVYFFIAVCFPLQFWQKHSCRRVSADGLHRHNIYIHTRYYHIKIQFSPPTDTKHFYLVMSKNIYFYMLLFTYITSNVQGNEKNPEKSVILLDIIGRLTLKLWLIWMKLWVTSGRFSMAMEV